MSSKLKIVNEYMSIVKRAFLMNLMPNGMMFLSFQVADEDGNILNETGIINKISVFDPSGNILCEIEPDKIFSITGTKGSGHYRVGTEKFLLWGYADMAIPQKGNYQLNIYDKDDNLISVKLPFFPEPQDNIDYFPKKASYDKETRTIKWENYKEDLYYKIDIFKGLKQGFDIEWYKLIFSSSINTPILTENFYKIPDSLNIKNDENYYMIVTAYYSSTGNYRNNNNAFVQDLNEHIAVIASDKTDKQNDAEKEDFKPLSFKELKYPYQEKYFDYKGNQICYIDEGEGEPIVFANGLYMNLSGFKPLYPDLINKGFRIIGFDYIGYGKSDKPDVEYNYELQSDILKELLSSLKLNKIYLAGQSMGGSFSLYFTQNNEDLVEKLVLLSPAGLTDIDEKWIQVSKESYEQAMGVNLTKPEAAENYIRKNAQKSEEGVEELINQRRRLMQHTDWEKFKRAAKDMSFSLLDRNNEISKNIGNIKVPVLLLLGEKDPEALINISEVKKIIAERTKNWVVKTFKDAGHILQYDAKDEVIAEILDFLK